MSFFGSIYTDTLKIPFSKKAMVFQKVLLQRKVCNIINYKFSRLCPIYLTISIQGLRIDAQTGLDYLTSHPLFKNTPIVSAGTTFQLSSLLRVTHTTVHKNTKKGFIWTINRRCSGNRPR